MLGAMTVRVPGNLSRIFSPAKLRTAKMALLDPKVGVAVFPHAKGVPTGGRNAEHGRWYCTFLEQHRKRKASKNPFHACMVSTQEKPAVFLSISTCFFVHVFSFRVHLVIQCTV